jgi:hypothetical protein
MMQGRKEIDRIVVSLSALQSVLNDRFVNDCTCLLMTQWQDTEALQQFANRLETYATNIVGIAVRLGFRPRV